MPDLQRVLVHDNALDHQVQERLLVGEGRIVRRERTRLQKATKSVRTASACALATQALMLQALFLQRPPPRGDGLPPLRQLSERDDLRLVGVQ